MPVDPEICHIFCATPSWENPVLEDLHCQTAPEAVAQIFDRSPSYRYSVGSQETQGNAKRTHTQAVRRKKKIIKTKNFLREIKMQN